MAFLLRIKKTLKNCLFFLLISASFNLHAFIKKAPPTVWDVLRQQFKIDHHTHRPEVQEQITWLIQHPDYLKRFTQSEPYIYHILSEIKKRNLPGEIALVPMIESAYNPFAYSHAGAAGLWQIMPKTGTDLGLKKDWWIEPRRSIAPSTDAALTYYTYLCKFFNGNWLLAFAAYDTGEGHVTRAIQHTNHVKTNDAFWHLKLPQETKTYVPRLLALAEIINHPKRYHVDLPNVPYKPYFKEIDIGQQINLSHAAKLAGMSYQDFIQLNPGYNRWATAPYAPYKLLVPVHQSEFFLRSLSKISEYDQQSQPRYKVHPNETLSGLMQQRRTTKVIHIVQKNDSFKQLIQKYGVSETAIRTWNHLGDKDTIQPGQELLIWKNENAGHYIVKAGDSLSLIASRQNISLKQLIALNPGIQQYLIKPGQKIQIS